jgi:hypothetical protein
LPFVRGAFVAIEHLERADAGVVDEVVCAQEVGVLAGDEGLVPDELADWLSWQSLRHSFASMLATNLELPATTLAQLVGQADTGFTLRVYARDGRDAATVVKDVLSRARRAKVGR